MEPFGQRSIALGFVIATLMSLRGVKRKSLSKDGAIAAWTVGFLSVVCGLRGFVLLFFYLIGSKATKYKIEIKKTLDASEEGGAVRGASQVFCSSALSVVCNLLHVCYCGEEQPIDFKVAPLASLFASAVLAHHATVLADTLASELGILSETDPILITTFRRVPPGTNGGISLWGTICSGIGGFLMGLLTVLMDIFSGLSPLQPLKMIFFGSVCGVLGSLVDSLLGATLQESYYDAERKLTYQHENVPNNAKLISGVNILSNAQVNLVSVVIMCALGGFVLGPAVF